MTRWKKWLALAVLVGIAAFSVWWLRRPEPPPPLAAPTDFLPPVAAPKAAPAPSAVCRDRYAALYGDDELDVRIVFGYKDARPARFVGDRYEKALLVSYLVAPCRDGSLACGFRRHDDDEDFLGRDIVGPDGKTRRVRLYVVSSAAGPDDDENRQNPLQPWRTRHAEELFTGGLGAADVVLYDGHSRDGGGPDFAPPRLAWAQHTDYPWYAKHRPGLVLLQRGLGMGGERSAKLLGLYSCASDGHFVARLKKQRPQLALVTSRRTLYWADALRSILGTLSSILGQWCPPDVDATLKAASAGGTIHVTGLFD